MKKKTSLILVFLLICVLFATLSACNKATANIIIDGDIAGGEVSVNLQKIKQEKYTYDDDGTNVKAKGWNLKTVLEKADYLYDDNYLMITSARDGVSVLLEAPLTGTVYLYKNNEGKLCSKGLDYPRATGIKDISEITVITKNTENITEGFKVLTVNKTEYISRGNAKLKLFELSAINKMGDNAADKYLPAADLTVSHFTGRDDNVAYFTDYDMLKSADFKTLSWKQGNLTLKNGNESKPVYGFATGVDTTILDFYSLMKEEIDADKKVMFILPDGFSWQQANLFENDLNTLKASRAQGCATSTHLSISPVALAAIVTGQSPFVNGVHFDQDESRAVLKPKVPDIFDYAVSRDKSVSYLEGCGNLIVTNVLPSYGLSDRQTYENAKAAIAADKDLIFVHFHEIDDTNHKYSAISAQSKAKCMEIDGYIADLKAQFNGKIIIVPDHGHNVLYDENNNAYGKHGMFTNFDMYIPYFIYC